MVFYGYQKNKFKKAENMHQKTFPELPVTGLLRLATIIGNRKADPPIIPLIPISRSTFLAGVRSGRYPLKPIKISERCVAYRVEEVRALIESLTMTQ